MGVKVPPRGNPRQIPVKTKIGMIYALVDDVDYERLRVFKWYLVKGKPCRNLPNYGGSRYMSQDVLGKVGGLDIDHRNHDLLDNTQTNLRHCTRSQNSQNKACRGDSQSGVKGISPLYNGKWRARIQVGEKRLHLGCFNTQEEARQAYNKAALEHFGRFAYVD